MNLLSLSLGLAPAPVAVRSEALMRATRVVGESQEAKGRDTEGKANAKTMGRVLVAMTKADKPLSQKSIRIMAGVCCVAIGPSVRRLFELGAVKNVFTRGHKHFQWILEDGIDVRKLPDAASVQPELFAVLCEAHQQYQAEQGFGFGNDGGNSQACGQPEQTIDSASRRADADELRVIQARVRMIVERNGISDSHARAAAAYVGRVAQALDLDLG